MSNGDLKELTLSDAQKDVIRFRDHHLQVEAGAGSGKTTILVEKMGYELGYLEVDGERCERPLNLDEIGAITFTRKAAGELKERLRRKIGGLARRARGREREDWVARSFAVDDARIGTIDSFAGELIRDFGPLAGVEAGFEILDPGDAASIRRELAEQALTEAVREGVEGANWLVRHYGYDRSVDWLSDVLGSGDRLQQVLAREPGRERWERLGIEPEVPDLALETHIERVRGFLETVYDRYRDYLETEGVLDHTHVLLRACRLAKEPEVQAAFRRQMSLLFVDEHQDTSLIQMVLLFRLAGLPGFTGLPEDEPVPHQTLPDGRPALRIVLIGDPKQSIYQFRNADVELWQKSWRVLERAGGQQLSVPDNYRTRPSLLRFQNDFLGQVMASEECERNFEIPYQELEPKRPESEGEPVEVLLSEEGGPPRTAELVADRIVELLESDEPVVAETDEEGNEVYRPAEPGDIAILSRALRRSASHFERALRERGLDCHVHGGAGLFNRPEIQQMTSLLRAVADPQNPVALTAYLRSPLGGLDDVSLAELAAVSTASPAEEPEASSLFEALERGDEFLEEPDQQERADRAYRLLTKLREVRERVSHDRLLEMAIEETGYRAFLAGAPDSPVGLRNLEKLLRIARQSGREPLSQFVSRLRAKVESRDTTPEAVLFTPEDDLITISTLHKAKGLEFPIVFLAGCDEPFFYRTRRTQPHLSSTHGLVFPLEVAVRQRDEAGFGASLGRGAVWQDYHAEATWREYAEAKRLMYVGCTRARDQLYLVGSPYRSTGGQIRRPRSLEDNRLDYLHKHTPMVWLQFCFDELLAPRDERWLTYGEEDQYRARIRYRPATEAAEAGEEEEDEADETSSDRRSWPRHELGLELVGERDEALEEDVQRRMASLEGTVVERTNFSTTELVTFDRCPSRHMLRYRSGVSRPEIEVRTDQPVAHQIPPEIRGQILHQWFARLGPDADEDEQLRQMEEIFLRSYPMAEETAEENARHLLTQARRFLESPLYHELSGAPQQRRELPFFYRLAEDTTVSGVIDWMVRLEDGDWAIVDLKAGRFANPDQVDDAQLEERARRYRIQAALYTLGAQEALREVDQRVSTFHFYFTHAGLPLSLPITDEWLQAERERIQQIVGRIRARDYGDEACDQGTDCNACRYLRRVAV